MVGEHNPTAGDAFQAGSEFRIHGMGLDQDLSLRRGPTTGAPQPPSRSEQVTIETWGVMLKRGWRPCRAPAR